MLPLSRIPRMNKTTCHQFASKTNTSTTRILIFLILSTFLLLSFVSGYFYSKILYISNKVENEICMR